MRPMYMWAFVAVCGFSAALPSGDAAAQAQTFKVDTAESKIQFVSDAPLEKFTGTLNEASGEVVVDPNAPAAAKGTIKVEVASIKTGIKLRDEHVVADNWLDAKQFPQATFSLTKVSGIEKLKPGEAVDATVSGKFTLHGVTKDVTSSAKIRLTPAQDGKKASLRIVGSFTIKLEDHKVSIPSIVALKVSPNIVVNLDLRAIAE